MKYPLYLLTEEMRNKLAELGATVCNVSKHYSFPYANQISSIHFFKNDEFKNGQLEEVAYFSPDMHSHKLGKMSGFNVIERPNGIDITNLIPFSQNELQGA